MAFDEVSGLLEQYEQLARERGSIAVEYLRPGLSLGQIDDVEQRHGFTLSEDVKAIWSWHNGIGPRPSPETPRRIGAAWDFMDLDRSIDHANSSLLNRNSGDADRYVFSRWVTFAASSVSAVIETSNTRIPDSPVLVDDVTQSVLNYPIVTVAEKLRWFIWAIENEAWHVDDKGAWQSNFDLFPKNAFKDVI
ncbi:SMI1/KNR4 family protein [Microcella flavibacter]|uniref:SMI1/KNR4 family protein n=1 Tax=Microcella flavibacter TaxID=1804990 RepID=UPI00145781BB|nr:SMI1/KNR4 family protein [Microcella flavibacter]